MRPPGHHLRLPGGGRTARSHSTGLADPAEVCELECESVSDELKFRFWAGEVGRVAEQRPITHAMEDAAGPSELAKLLAVKVIESGLSLGLDPVRVIDTAAEGISVRYRGGRHYVIVECENKGYVVLSASDPDQGDSVQAFAEPDIPKVLQAVLDVVGPGSVCR